MVKGLIYLITNNVNGNKYVGQTIQTIHKRWIGHLISARNGRGNSIGRAIRKYGKDNFTVEAIVEGVPEYFLSAFEKYWINFHNTFRGIGYNCTEGGEGTRGVIPWNKGIATPADVRKKQSDAAKGRSTKVVNLEQLRQLAKERVGTKHHNYKAANIYNYETCELIADNVSISQWCRENGYSQGTMSATARGLTKQYRGLYAKYI